MNVDSFCLLFVCLFVCLFVVVAVVVVVAVAILAIVADQFLLIVGVKLTVTIMDGSSWLTRTCFCS